MKKRITGRDDIETLVRNFYEKVKADDCIGFIFNDIAKVNWEKHLSVMFDFWENVLFYTGSYEGNPMLVHQHINHVIPLTKEHFLRWYQVFEQTVDELFEGQNAILIKQKAYSISTVMQIKIINGPLD